MCGYGSALVCIILPRKELSVSATCRTQVHRLSVLVVVVVVFVVGGGDAVVAILCVFVCTCSMPVRLTHIPCLYVLGICGSTPDAVHAHTNIHIYIYTVISEAHVHGVHRNEIAIESAQRRAPQL